jgi:hypothetical protein
MRIGRGQKAPSGALEGHFRRRAATVVMCVVGHWSRTECEAGMPVLPVINRDVNEVLHMLPFRQLKILGLK